MGLISLFVVFGVAYCFNCSSFMNCIISVNLLAEIAPACIASHCLGVTSIGCLIAPVLALASTKACCLIFFKSFCFKSGSAFLFCATIALALACASCSFGLLRIARFKSASSFLTSLAYAAFADGEY